jgi:FixJ family two-component response regulator
MTEAQSIVFVIDDNAAVRKALDSLIRSVGTGWKLSAQRRNFQERNGRMCPVA